MRVAVIVVSMLVLTTPSEASTSCMSKTEARQHFGSVHIYWHGADHCWDATRTRHHPIHNIQRTDDQTKWHNSLSEMVPDDEPLQTLGARTSWDAQQHRNDPAAAGAPWIDRWVDIVQVAPPPIIERIPEPMVTPRGVVMMIITIALTLAIVVLFGGLIYERLTSRRNTRFRLDEIGQRLHS
jgi:hypothetical protein